jgi:hypothetical protein
MTMTKEYVISLFLFNLWSNILINFLTVSCKIMLSITTENALIEEKKMEKKCTMENTDHLGSF